MPNGLKCKPVKTERRKSKVQSPKSSDSNLFSDESIGNHLEKAASDLRAAKQKSKGDLRETLDRVSSRLEELGQNITSAEKLEESLEKLDALIDESLLK